jgi:hypothetical protein
LAGANQTRLEFVRMSFGRSAREMTRHAFCEQLRRILAEQFPDEIVESLMISPDLEHSLSGNYVRGILRRGSAEWAILGATDSESADTVENSLTFALLWLERARQSSRRGTIAGLRLILPKDDSRRGATRRSIASASGFGTLRARSCARSAGEKIRDQREMSTVGLCRSERRNRCWTGLARPWTQSSPWRRGQSACIRR